MDINAIVDEVTKEVMRRMNADNTGAPVNVAKTIDHTLLKPDATREQIKTVCDEAKTYGFASVCVNPSFIGYVAEELRGSNVSPCCVIGFPLGATLPDVKAFETEAAISKGAREVDMVINIGAAKGGEWDTVKKDIEAVVHASHGRALVKVIIESCLLTDAEKVKACELAKAAGADFVKTSTGFSKGGATVEDIRLMRRTVGPQMGVKASGGVRDYKTAMDMIQAGATRLGTSSGAAIVKAISVAEPAKKCISCGNCDSSCPMGLVQITKQQY